MAEHLDGPTVLNNRSCAYCGQDLSTLTATKEHVIGRRFVPRGSLNGSWNLILRACESCNGAKSSLEDDLSAISMQPNALGQFHHASDTRLREEADRKGAGSLSRQTGKPVAMSQQTLLFHGNLGPARLEMSFVGPPQPDEARVAALAQFHVTGLMYWLTYDEELRIGYFIQGRFLPLRSALRDDWGNTVHREFMRKVANWEERLVGYAAKGNFGVAIRRFGTSPCWSWAFEWNRNLRAVGFLGEEHLVTEQSRELSELKFDTFRDSDGGHWRRRREQPLDDAEDELFKRS